MVEITAMEQNKEKIMKRYEDSLRDFRDNIKCTNIHIIGAQKERRERTRENIKVTTPENFPIMGKETDVQVQEMQRVP